MASSQHDSFRETETDQINSLFKGSQTDYSDSLDSLVSHLKIDSFNLTASCVYKIFRGNPFWIVQKRAYVCVHMRL